HDLGHEVFLVLEGQADIEIAGERAVLGPGQLCMVRATQMHRVRNAGEGPLVLYLSVSPHVEPTHTYWTESGDRLPPRYGGATREEMGPPPPPAQIPELGGRKVAGMQQLLQSVQTAVDAHGRL